MPTHTIFKNQIDLGSIISDKSSVSSRKRSEDRESKDTDKEGGKHSQNFMIFLQGI
jgi:hypothetical protein